MGRTYSIGLDYGTNSVRALVVDVTNGREVGTAVWSYEHGDAGVVLSRDPNLARQHPAKRTRPQFLGKIGGTYSSEWFFSKILRCARTRLE